MKPVFISFTDEEGKQTKQFTTCSLKSGMMDQIFDIAERADVIEKGDISLKEVKDFYNDLKAIIVSIFNYKFSLDELNESVEQEELSKVFGDICENIKDAMGKN